MAGLLGWHAGVFQKLALKSGADALAQATPEIESPKAPTAPAKPAAHTRLQPDTQPDMALLSTGLVTLQEGRSAVRRYRLALNEIYDMTPGREGVRSIPAQADARAVEAYMAAQVAKGEPWPALVLYPEKGPAERSTRRILTGKMLVELSSEQTATPDLKAAGLQVLERPKYSPKHVITRSEGGSPWQALAAIPKAGALGQVATVTPLFKQAIQTMALPNDPLLPQQWHLRNTGQGKGVAGMDAQVTPVWDLHHGAGIDVAIVDSGIDMTHTDLADNVATFGHFEPTAGEAPAEIGRDVDGHGTMVAGVVAGVADNNRGIAGVAPQSRLFSLRLLNGSPEVDVSEVASFMAHGNDHIHIKNNSWGWVTGPTLGVSSEIFTDAMKQAATEGRGGKGVISVWASGNGRSDFEQGNKAGLSNDIHAITVGAVTNTGKLASYSETGAHLTCVGPSGGGTLGVTTTDMTGLDGYNPDPNRPDLESYNYSYTSNATGTSFAAPVVSGVCALMLEANPALSWRDVKEILLRTSLKIDPKSPGWVTRTGGIQGDELMPPIKHHSSYGGGLVQAKAAVDMALAWKQQNKTLGAQVTVEKTIDPDLSISYSGHQAKSFQRGKMASIITPPKKPKHRTVVASIDMSNIQPLRVETVAVTLNIEHAYRGDLGIVLRSPSGVGSVLVARSPWDFDSDIQDFTFSSMRHWGESGQGVWKLEITDYTVENSGTFQSATLRLTGTAAPAAQFTSQSGYQFVEEGQPVTLQVNSDLSTEGGTRAWRKGGKVIPKQTSATLPGIGLKVADAGVYDQTITNKWGTVISAPIPVVVMRRQVQDILVNEGKTVTFTAVYAGANLVTQWYRSDSEEPLVNNGRITGVTTPVLTIRDTRPEDEDTYYCRVALIDPATIPQNAEDDPVTILAEMSTIPADLSIRRKPVVNADSMNAPVSVSETQLRQLSATHQVTRWSVTGLPPGVTFDSKTARILGAPTKAGRYTMTIIAINSIGGSEPVYITWDVMGLPDEVIGTFHGLLDRNERYNGGFGGMVTLTTTSTGSYSGTLTRGMHKHTFKGRLNASSVPGAAPTGEVLLPRATPYGPLTFQFSLRAESESLDGTITDPTITPADIASVNGLRASASAGAFAGRWNTAHELPLPLISNVTYPQGATWSTQVVSAKGAAVLTGRLADGVSFTSSAGLSAEGSAPVHAMLYKNLGSIHGWHELDDVTDTTSASLSWWKTPVANSRSYAFGFPEHILVGAGARYIVPGADEMLFGIGISPDNASLTFTEGGLAVPFVQTFTLGLKNVVSLPQGSANPHQIKLAMDLKTGIVTGTGAAMDINPLNPAQNRQRPGTFSALLIPQREEAVGHFLLPASTSKTSPILSGKLVGGETRAP